MTPRFYDTNTSVFHISDSLNVVTCSTKLSYCQEICGDLFGSSYTARKGLLHKGVFFVKHSVIN